MTADRCAPAKTASVGARQDERANDAREKLVGSDFEYERRMNNWRLWRLSERRSFGGSPFPIYNLTPRPPRGENIMPILAGEAEETDTAVMNIRPALRRAVEVWFLAKAASIRNARCSVADAKRCSSLFSRRVAVFSGVCLTRSGM